MRRMRESGSRNKSAPKTKGLRRRRKRSSAGPVRMKIFSAMLEPWESAEGVSVTSSFKRHKSLKICLEKVKYAS
jgi:hypothetical protein